jgi:Ca-activated chloride channel family protein
MSVSQSYYDVLSLAPTATADDIRQAYRRLAKQYHPDAASEPDTLELFRRVQEAYEVLGDETRRSLYDVQQTLRAQETAQPFTLTIRSSHPQLKQLNDPQMSYQLVEVRATDGYMLQRPILNLCLVLDRSRSMDGPRMQQAKEAASYLIDHLNDADHFSVIAFNDRARAILEGPLGVERSSAKSEIRALQPEGGTELLQGLKAGLDVLRRCRSASSVEHLILLTDGQTYGDEEGCLSAAQTAAEEKIGMTLLGLGNDWNDKLLDEMALRSSGYAGFVDSPAKLVSIFKERLQEISTVIARGVQLVCHLNVAAEVKEAFRLMPDIGRIPWQGNTLALGTLEQDHPIYVVLELAIQTPSVGPLRAARLSVSGELVSIGHTHAHVEADIVIDVTEQSHPNWRVPGELANILGRVAAFKVQERAMSEVEQGHYERATNRLKALATHLLNFGEVELARVTLLEADALARTGQLTDEGRKRIHYGTRSLSQTALLSE